MQNFDFERGIIVPINFPASKLFLAYALTLFTFKINV